MNNDLEIDDLEIDYFISKKDFESYLLQIIRSNIGVFDNFNVLNILVRIDDVPIFDIHRITINSGEMFRNIFNTNESNKLDIIIHEVSMLHGKYKHKNCILIVLGNNTDFITFTYQFNETQMNEFNNQ